MIFRGVVNTKPLDMNKQVFLGKLLLISCSNCVAVYSQEKSELERLVSESSHQDTELKQLRLAADRERRGLEELRTEHAALETSIAVMTKDHSQLQHTSTNMDDKLNQIKK